MMITKELLKEWSACADGYEWFIKNFPEGGNLQPVLDALCDAYRISDAEWLLGKSGPSNDVLEIDFLEAKTNFVFAGELKIKFNISIKGRLIVGRSIKAGEGIKAGRDIKAGEGIEAGCGIKAGEGIKAGDDFGIFAGLKAKLSEWKICAKITAKQKPENLISGHWGGNEN